MAMVLLHRDINHHPLDTHRSNTASRRPEDIHPKASRHNKDIARFLHKHLTECRPNIVTNRPQPILRRQLRLRWDTTPISSLPQT
jgi:hypothetical protein